MPPPATGPTKSAPPSKLDEDKLMELCLEHGVDDYDFRTVVDGSPFNPEVEGKSAIYVAMGDMVALRDALRGVGYIVETSLRNIPKDGCVDVSDEDFEKNMAAIDAFDELDDVDSVEHNIDMVDEEP